MLPFDHELKIGSTTKGLKLVRQNGQALYTVGDLITSSTENYQEEFRYTQTDWLGGHGRHDFNQYEGDRYFEGQSIDTTQPGRIFLGPLITEVKESDDTALDSAVEGFRWFEATGELLCWTSGKIYRYDVGSNAKWTAATTTVSGITDLCEHDGIMYAARGASTTYSYSSDGDTWTATDLTDDKAVKFLSAPSGLGLSNVLWKVKTPNEVTSTTDGRTVAAGGSEWSSPAYIGDTSDNITNIWVIAGMMFVGREDNLYYYTATGRTEPQMDDLKVSRDANNFKYITIWKTSAYFSLLTDIGELTTAASFYTVGPLTRIDDIGKAGTCVGLSSEPDYIYCAMDEGTNTIIYKGREITRTGGLRWEWCPWIFGGTNVAKNLRVVQHSATDRRLWFSYGASGTTTAYVELYDDPTANSSANFAPSGWIRMPYTYGSDPYWVKNLSSVISETEGCTANLTVTPKYRKDTDTSATQLTAAITGNGVNKTDATTEVSCNRIQFELHLVTNSSASTPEVKYFQARGQEQPEYIKTHDCTYSVAGTEFEDTATLVSFLEGGATATATIRFSDLNFHPAGTGGTENTDWVHVKMMGRPEETYIYHEKDKQPELAVRIRFREVNV